MKTVQKLEVFAGLATLATVLLYYYFFVYPEVRLLIESQQHFKKNLLWSFLILILPALLIAFGSYLHAVKHNKAGLVLLLIGDSVSIFFCGLGLLSLDTRGLFYALIIIMWGIFATTTLVCAIRSESQVNTLTSSSKHSGIQLIQGLELGAGIACVIAVLMFIYFVDIPQSKGIAKLYNDSSGYHWITAFLFFILPSLLIAVSSYFHAIKRNNIGLAVIIILGGILSFLNAIGFLIGSAFEGHVWIGISPGFFAFMTIVFALINTVLFSTKPNIIHKM